MNSTPTSLCMERTSVVEAYDPNADQWWGVKPLPAPRRDHGVAGIEHRRCVVAAGGYDGQRYLGDVDVFDPRANRWTSAAPLRTPRQLHGIASAGDEVYVVGGFDGKEGLRSVEVYDMRADRWKELAPMSGVRFGVGVAAF